MSESERVLVLAPAGRDADLARDVLGGVGLEAVACRSMRELCREVERGAGAALLTEEACAPAGELVELLERQEPWSDLPLVVLTSNRLSTYPAIEALRRLGTGRSVTFFERPVRRMSLVSALHVALQARRRQYELRDLIARLARDVEQRDEFLALLGHELRNPLGAMRNCVEVLRLGPGAVGPEDADFALTTVDRQVHHMTRLIDDLLDISRVTRGRLRLKVRPLDLRDVLEQSLLDTAELFRQRGVECAFEPPAAELPVSGDEVRLVQVLTNVLGNGARYTPGGGRVSARARLDGPAVELRVRDTGPGLAPEMLERVFEPFERGESAGEGLGVGLTLARRIAEMHGGHLWAESEGPGRGSEFVLRLPLAERRPGGTDAGPPARGAPQAPCRVLIVEDHRDQARTLRLVVESMGHRVCLAHDGRRALELARAWRPHVVLLDLDLPDVEGCEVARRLRDDARLDCLLVAVTGFGLELDRNRTRRAGCAEHLTKPVTPSQLRSVFQHARGG